jgi:serine protease Do
MAFASLCAAAFGLAGCATSPTVDLEARTIAVQAGDPMEPAAAVAAIGKIVPVVGPTYVTLNVSEKGNTAAGQSERQTKAISSGSGYVVDAGGLIMTAAHVAVKKGNAVSARAANGRVYSGEVIAMTPSNDMAIIKLRAFSGHAAVPALPGCLGPKDPVFTLGRPHAQGDTARTGTLESRHFGRAVAYGKFGYPDALVLRMNTQKGESGGPLFNSSGKLVGMVVSTLTDANGNLINLAHAIPATTLAKFLCSQTTCNSTWAQVAKYEVDGCDLAASQ